MRDDRAPMRRGHAGGARSAQAGRVSRDRGRCARAAGRNLFRGRLAACATGGGGTVETPRANAALLPAKKMRGEGNSLSCETPRHRAPGTPGIGAGLSWIRLSQIFHENRNGEARPALRPVCHEWTWITSRPRFPASPTPHRAGDNRRRRPHHVWLRFYDRKRADKGPHQRGAGDGNHGQCADENAENRAEIHDSENMSHARMLRRVPRRAKDCFPGWRVAGWGVRFPAAGGVQRQIAAEILR